MSSSLNTLIGTFSSIDFNSLSTTIDSSNLICIDISNNRIGINTIDPSYSIHIKKLVILVMLFLHQNFILQIYL